MIKSKKVLHAAVLMAIASIGTAHADDFINGGFESGLFTGWSSGTGNWATGDYDPSLVPPRYIDPTTLTTSGGSVIVTTGFDPIVSSLNMVYSGNYAARVNFETGSPNGGADASYITQTVSNYGSSTINFAWSVVLEEPGHTVNSQPHFYIKIVDVTGGGSTEVYSQSYNASSSGIFSTTPNGEKYSGWRAETANVTLGHDYQVTLLAADCSLGGHWGYAYLDGFGFVVPSSGPSAGDTQSSMRYQAGQLRSAFNTQTVAANFALNYDCNVFDVKGLCISAGGRYTTIDNPNINNSAAVVTLGYKVNPNIRIGAYLDQNINISHPTGINISNNTPLMGAYAVWNKEQSGLGYQVRLANTYQDKDVTSTRTVFDTSEAGSGKSSLTSQSYLAELSYAFQYQDKTLVRPYAGLRYTHLKQDGYTEGSVDNPLTLASLRDKSATALLGVKINRSLTDKATLTAQLGLEQDVHHKVGNYSATNSNIGDLDSVVFNSNIKRTRPVASIGAFYDVTKTQRASATINYQQTPFQSTGSATAYFNYMIGF